MLLTFEDEYYSAEISNIAGVDEAGRGPLAGPVVACAIVLPRAYLNNEVNDSKQLSDRKRRILFRDIIAHCLSYGIGIVSPETIDEINIYQAAKLAMKIAIGQLDVPVDCIMTDAMPLDGYDVPVYDIIKGDAKVRAIAAASIVAKVIRDDIMLDFDKRYPEYHFKNNKGYPTKAHLEALRHHGPIKGLHRYTFGPVARCLIEKISLL
ncbi:MAG TPA: ribonuclease HII [Bacilli bacterium]|nr:ribonuclease HII [Bacilli bacterium]